LPIYLLLNQYWQSIVRLLVAYGLLMLFCLRLGEYLQRVMRRLPAEIPPWSKSRPAPLLPRWMEPRFGAAEAIRLAHRDPQYVQTVLKPRLRRLLAYRLSGSPDTPLERLDDTQLAGLDPKLLNFLRRQEAVSLWARLSRRRERSHDVLEVLRHLEAL
jgi:hypothetical protein